MTQTTVQEMQIMVLQNKIESTRKALVERQLSLEERRLIMADIRAYESELQSLKERLNIVL